MVLWSFKGEGDHFLATVCQALSVVAVENEKMVKSEICLGEMIFSQQFGLG